MPCQACRYPVQAASRRGQVGEPGKHQKFHEHNVTLMSAHQLKPPMWGLAVSRVLLNTMLRILTTRQAWEFQRPQQPACNPAIFELNSHRLITDWNGCNGSDAAASMHVILIHKRESPPRSERTVWHRTVPPGAHGPTALGRLLVYTKAGRRAAAGGDPHRQLGQAEAENEGQAAWKVYRRKRAIRSGAGELSGGEPGGGAGQGVVYVGAEGRPGRIAGGGAQGGASDIKERGACCS